jgi:hypothetical protein
MANLKSQEKQQSVWSLAIALSVMVTVFAPQEISAQNGVTQEIGSFVKGSLQTVVAKTIN